MYTMFVTYTELLFLALQGLPGLPGDPGGSGEKGDTGDPVSSLSSSLLTHNCAFSNSGYFTHKDSQV
jgi:hypothetical protein